MTKKKRKIKRGRRAWGDVAKSSIYLTNHFDWADVLGREDNCPFEKTQK